MWNGKYILIWPCTCVLTLYRALDSVKAGKRLSEAKYSDLHIALEGQQSVRSTYFAVQSPASS